MAEGRALRPLVAIAVCLLAIAAEAAQVAQDIRFTTSDGVELLIKLGGEGPAPLPARPLIVEFSPYRPGCCATYGGDEFNYLQVHIRGTGDSDGRFDSLGERTQRDVVEVLDWACHQPWSDGHLGIFGFSASAITIYNSLHFALPCAQAAVLWSGTHELYRDLIYPGGINNSGPALGVLGLIGVPAIGAVPDRLGRNAPSTLDMAQGLVDAGVDGGLAHPTLDGYWQERGWRGDVNHLPTLVVDGFFDVESRGAFQGYQALRADGAHLMVIGAHDGVPAGTAGLREAEGKAWFDHFVRNVANGVDAEPKVKLWLADGDREDDLAGKFVRFDGTDWPIPGTHWESLALDAATSGSAHSLNDGSLVFAPAATVTSQVYATIPSLPSATDPPNVAILGDAGANALANAFPILTEMTLAEPLGLSYTTPALGADVLTAGPASLELRLSSTAPETDIWAVISDVFPDGTPHPVALGRLRSSFPFIDESRSLTDPQTGDIVQPYGIYDQKTPAGIGEERLYRVEFFPIGNRFQKGHRVRLHVIGLSAASMPSSIAINSVRVGGSDGSRLLLPVLPGSDLRAAIP